MDVVDRLVAEAQVAGLHVSLLTSGLDQPWFPFGWIKFQWTLGSLLRIEAFRRYDTRRKRRLGIEDSTGGGLPHVDTGKANPISLKAVTNTFINSILYPIGLQTIASAQAAALEMTKMSKMQAAMNAPPPLLKQLVLIGGGHSHAFVIKNLGMKPLEGVEITLITRDLDTPYSGMLPGHVAGVYTRDECHIDLVRLGNFAKARIVHSQAIGIDRKNQLVMVDDGRPPIRYDVLSINIGSSPKLLPFSSPRLAITPVKPIDGFSRRWEAILEKTLKVADGSNGCIKFAVVGAGAGGVELCLCMCYRLHRELEKLGRHPQKCVHFTLIGRNKVIMPLHARETQREFEKILKHRGIALEIGVSVEGYDDEGALKLSDGRALMFDECFWCTNASAQAWLGSTGLHLDSGGFIKVNQKMQTSDPKIFAGGDIVRLPSPRPKAGVFAVRAGPPLCANIRIALTGLNREHLMEIYDPQSLFLGIIGTGDVNLAVASKGSMAVKGAWLWALKDWIDRQWMAQYTSGLPDMAAKMEDAIEKLGPMGVPEVARIDYQLSKEQAASGSSSSSTVLNTLKHASMRCGGCGAKVGATSLSRVINQIKHLVYTPDDKWIVGIDNPDDCAVVQAPGPNNGDLGLVHTVDYFRTFLSDPYVFGQVSANHALSDCHAMCADAVSALAIAVLPFGVSEITEDTMVHMMAGACKMLGESKCTLVGGHSCEGAKLALGFAVNGVVNTSNALYKGIPKSRMLNPLNCDKDGFHIVITKAVGTGTIFAADMRLKARAPWVGAAIASMLISNREGGLFMREFDAAAATDITGFGVLGHLVEMMKATNDELDIEGEWYTAELDVSALPVLPGALECVKGGIFSSLQPDNLRVRRAILNEAEALQNPKYPLLFDPQTAGGIMAFIPVGKQVHDLIDVLKKAGYSDTAIIGKVSRSSKDSQRGTHQTISCK